MKYHFKAISDPPNTLTGKIETLELEYIAWGCACANWITPHDYKQYQDRTLSAHCIFIEPAEKSLHIPDYFDPQLHLIRVTGQFYINPGYPEGTIQNEEHLDKAKVFRYTKVALLKNANACIKENEKSSIDIVMEILTSSPTYINKTKGLYEAIIKNGGTSYGITVEGSPHPKKDKAVDFSETYDFNLHETYTDHMPVIARFTFNPSEKQLYEYDPADDSLKPIEFDRKLLEKYKESCK